MEVISPDACSCVAKLELDNLYIVYIVPVGTLYFGPNQDNSFQLLSYMYTYMLHNIYIYNI